MRGKAATSGTNNGAIPIYHYDDTTVIHPTKVTLGGVRWGVVMPNTVQTGNNSFDHATCMDGLNKSLLAR